MIKINLLIKPPPLVRWPVVASTALVAGLLGVASIGAYGWFVDRQRLEHEVAAAKKLLEDYNRVAARQREIEGRLDGVRKQRQALAKLERNQRFSQAAVLEAILATPPGVSVSEAAFAGAEVVITGRAGSFASAMQYLDHLRAAPLARSVSERSLRAAASGETSFTFAVRIRDQEGGQR